MSSFVKVAFATLLLSLSIQAQAGLGRGDYPMGPDLEGMTPGTVCEHADSYRYPEHIKYCSRDVDGGTKWEVIKAYNRKFGYNINSGNRQEFKIDHLIPLCMGGSNDPSNLWPQHKSIYPLTDPLEQLACEKMQAGRLKQARAIELIKQAKMNLNQVEEVGAILGSL